MYTLITFLLPILLRHSSCFPDSAALAADRNRRLLDKTAIQAVIEQIEYLRESERGKAKIVRLDENDRLFVDR